MEGKASEMRAAAEDGVSRVYDHGVGFGVDTATASLMSSGWSCWVMRAAVVSWATVEIIVR